MDSKQLLTKNSERINKELNIEGDSNWSKISEGLENKFRIINGKFYFKSEFLKNKEYCSEQQKQNYYEYHEGTNPLEEIWKYLKDKKKDENKIDLDQDLIENFVNPPQQTTVIFIISRINTYLRLLHEELDKGSPINDLGRRIDEEIDVLGQLIDIIQKNEIDHKSSTNFKTINAVIVEFAKFGFWQIFSRNLSLISSTCLKKFEKEIEGEELQAEFHSFQCDALFVHESEKSLPAHISDWSYKEERAKLRNLMRKIIIATKQVQTVQLRAAEQQSYSFQLLQQQQAQLHAIQQQQYGGASTNWNIGIAYRPPDSIFNISAGYQQGKANIQISMVPDEQASLLGATGFTAGVGPGNLGLSLNLNI